MGATYTRQSSYTDGDVITAAHTNDEFNQLLAAFQASSGHTHDGTANEGGPITKLLGNTLTFGAGTAGTDITITFDGETSDGVLKWMEDEDYFEFSDDILVASTEKLQFRDTAIYINSSTDGQLDLVADTEIQLAATTVDLNGNLDVSGSLTLGGTAITATASELNILDGVTSTAAELNILDGVTSTTAELNILDGVTSTASELNLLDGSTAGTVVASKAVVADSNKDVSGFRNLSITGDLTVAGDDITMGTNTSGNLLVADGTNFNSVAVGDLSEISTVANDDVFLAVDTSGGGLKKITRSTIVSGLAVGGVALSNIVEDTTPQLGGNLDMNGQDIVTTSNADIELAANGTGKVVVKGNTNQGAIKLNCEANSHGQIIIAAPHSESASNTLTLPSTGGDARLVSTSSTATLTNKTLTSPKINEDVAVTATATEINILDGVTSTTAELNILDGVTSTATELNILDGVTSTTAELNILDGVTSTASELNLVDGSSAGTIVNSKAVVYGSSGEVNATTLQIAGTSITSTAAELNILDGVTSTTAELNILDGVTSTAAELNILDGVTATATELNIMDGDTSASSTTLVDADRVVTNDNGTMKQVALTDVKTYLTSAGFTTDDPTALAIALG
jgi:hypothetical protein